MICSCSRMDHLCGLVGPAQCMTVRYEDLVTHTERVLRLVTGWLNITWDPDMLRHSQMVERVSTSHLETTRDQITRPVYREALDNWVGNISREVLDHLNTDLKFTAALRHFGYSPLV